MMFSTQNSEILPLIPAVDRYGYYGYYEHESIMCLTVYPKRECEALVKQQQLCCKTC